MVKDTLTRVINCIAATTRYPEKLLTVDADLENDLGIDSVKRVEIVVALADEFRLELSTSERDPSIRTIGDVARWIDRLQKVVRTAPVPHLLTGGEHDQDLATHRFVDPVVKNRLAAVQAVPEPHFLSPTRTEIPRPNTSRSLMGRVALVTGSGHGIGRTIARVLAARGATVVVNSFHSRDQGDQTALEIQSTGGNAVHLWGSIANAEHVGRIFGQIEEQFGRLDILVCNASDGRIGPFLELDWDDWDRAFRTNISGHHQCAIHAARLMRPQGGGAIVTLSAVGAHQFIDGLGSQGVVKAAVETLTRYLACELGHFGIRVNCVAGGPVYGELLSKFPSARATQNHWESITPDGELCTPMDLAQTIAFLVSDEARGINGAVWMVDHGFTARADGRPLRGAKPTSAAATIY